MYLWLLYRLDILTPLPLHNDLLCLLLPFSAWSLFYLSMSKTFLFVCLFFWFRVCFVCLFIATICLEQLISHFHPFTLSLFVFGTEMNLLKAAYSWILFFKPSSHSVPVDWWIQFIYSWADYWYTRTYYSHFISCLLVVWYFLFLCISVYPFKLVVFYDDLLSFLLSYVLFL